MPALFKTGDVLTALATPYGHPVVLAVKGDYVLCALPGAVQPFVTWWVSPRGEVLSGDYHTEMGDAIRSLTQRAAQRHGEAL